MGRRNVETDLYSRLLTSLHMSDISTVPVKHCPNSFGVAFRHCDGWKVTYSGDTMPCDDLVELGMYSRQREMRKMKKFGFIFLDYGSSILNCIPSFNYLFCIFEMNSPVLW